MSFEELAERLAALEATLTQRDDPSDRYPDWHIDEVSSCTHCPFSLVSQVEESERHYEVECGHGQPNGTARVVTRTAQVAASRLELPLVAPPHWCPLHEGPTVVRLARNGHG